MTACSLDLVSHWHIPAPAEQVWAALADPTGWPAWWVAVPAARALHHRQPAGAVQRWHLAWAAGGPFHGTLALESLEALPPERWRLRSGTRDAVRGAASGAAPGRWLQGECIWLLRGEGGHTQVTHVWRLQPPAGAPGWLWRLAAPLLRWLHGRAMRLGAAGLARHLDRAAPGPA